MLTREKTYARGREQTQIRYLYLVLMSLLDVLPTMKILKTRAKFGDWGCPEEFELLCVL